MGCSFLEGYFLHVRTALPVLKHLTVLYVLSGQKQAKRRKIANKFIENRMKRTEGKLIFSMDSQLKLPKMAPIAQKLVAKLSVKCKGLML